MSRRVLRVQLLAAARPPGVLIGHAAGCVSCHRITAWQLEGYPWCELCWWASPAAAHFRSSLERAMTSPEAEL